MCRPNLPMRHRRVLLPDPENQTDTVSPTGAAEDHKNRGIRLRRGFIPSQWDRAPRVLSAGQRHRFPGSIRSRRDVDHSPERHFSSVGYSDGAWRCRVCPGSFERYGRGMIDAARPASVFDNGGLETNPCQSRKSPPKKTETHLQRGVSDPQHPIRCMFIRCPGHPGDVRTGPNGPIPMISNLADRRPHPPIPCAGPSRRGVIDESSKR